MKSAFEMALEICRELDEATGESGAIGGAVQPGQPDPLDLPVHDPYAERMRDALCQINQPDYPAGMVTWIVTAHPALYEQLMARLPDEINRLWNARAPLHEFEAVLARLMHLHAQCCDLFCAATKR